MTADLVAASRFLSYVLRHRPDAIEIRLGPAGWIDVDALLAALVRHRRPLSLDELERIVAGTDKRRFELAGGRIRAAQGHSIDVDLGLDPVAPPERLYHGTVERSVARILAVGLAPMGRRHVHLSADVATAGTVGARRGEPVVLTIDALGMHRAGHAFFRASNGVWLTDHAPPEWINRS